MPNRIIRENILTSVLVSALGWPEEVFYRRLMSIVDDYGRFEALPQLVRSRCYPLQTDQVRVADITRWLAACQTAGLVVLYEVEGKQYLEIAKFGQQQRSTSKCPSPLSLDSKCLQVIADAPVFVSGVGDVIEDGGGGGKPARKRAAPRCPEGVQEQVWDDWLSLRKAKRAPVSQTVIDGVHLEAAKAGLTLEAFLRVWCRRGSQGLEASWLTDDERGKGRASPHSNRQEALEADNKRVAAEWLRDQAA